MKKEFLKPEYSQSRAAAVAAVGIPLDYTSVVRGSKKNTSSDSRVSFKNFKRYMASWFKNCGL